MEVKRMTEDNIQLGLGQYKLHHVVDELTPVDSGSVEYLLERRTPMAAGTEQQKIADAKKPLTDEETRYLLEPETSYENWSQQTLDTGVGTVTEQAELTDYSQEARVGAASD
jgi:hypothetical protein